MKIKVWQPTMSDKETADLAYWERNMLALRYAQGWYDDMIPDPPIVGVCSDSLPTQSQKWVPRYTGWRRALSLENGRITFHIPDDFDVGDLRRIGPNWDGHTTEEKWQRVAAHRNLETT